MADAQVHLEKGDGSVEWIKQFTEYIIFKRHRERNFL